MQDARSQTSNPLSCFIETNAAGHSPLPLKHTRIDIVISAGLAVVTVERRFRNDEPTAIEASMTFPVPVQAVLFELTAQIGERQLRAQAKSRLAAQAEFDDAMESGKLAVLHEEPLKGVHTLTVGQLPSGAEILLTSFYALPISARPQGGGSLRIPLTIGDIYGVSGLPDETDLVSANVALTGELRVRSDALASLAGAPVGEGWTPLAMDRPIDLQIAAWRPRPLVGCAADGATVELSIRPRDCEDQPLDALILVDHSGSMSGYSQADGAEQTTHESVLRGFDFAASRLTEADCVELWEFDCNSRRIGLLEPGETPAERFAALVAQLSEPCGGTEIGAALKRAMRTSKRQDILLVTDGKSWELDVHALARHGRRISAVLIGEDSLEASVGQLAALTGGEIFIASDGQAGEAIVAALESLRSERSPQLLRSEAPRSITRHAGGMELTALWRRETAPSGTLESRAVAAFAANMALPSLPEKLAAEKAETEGLVTHLTSLILVDEDGAAQHGAPVERHIALPFPATASVLANLTPREGRVLRMRFGIGMKTDHTLEEVGPQFSVTRERIRQIEVKALRKLKNPSRSHKLRSFLDDDGPTANQAPQTPDDAQRFLNENRPRVIELCRLARFQELADRIGLIAEMIAYAAIKRGRETDEAAIAFAEELLAKCGDGIDPKTLL